MTMSVPCYLYIYLYGLPMTTQRKEKHRYFTVQRSLWLLTFITCIHATFER
jgi:hypothetical protein